MTRSKIKYIFLFLIGIFIVFLSLNYTYTEVYAEDLCPNMDDDTQECLEYLQNKQKNLEDEKDNLQNQLAQEEYEQLSLSGKISYVETQIKSSEKLIESMEVDIAAQQVEISLLEKQIQDTEDNISIIKQEINVLEKTVGDRIEESYKYSFIGPLEIFLSGGGLDNILTKIKYLTATREEDKKALEEMNDKVGELNAEELELESSKENLETKKTELEADKTELVTEKAELDVQEAKYNELLVESKAKSAEYETQLNSLTKAAAEIDNAVAALILQLYNTGKLGSGTHVDMGDTIGIDGHTGCAYGTHLHFVVYKNSNFVNPLNYLTYSGGYLTSGYFYVPMSGAYLTQGYSSSHYAIDMVSTTSGDQSGNKYCVNAGDLKCDTGFDNCSLDRDYWFNMRGEGAPVRAASDGYVYYYTDRYGGNYAFLVHDDGTYKTLYLHLKY